MIYQVCPKCGEVERKDGSTTGTCAGTPMIELGGLEIAAARIIVDRGSAPDENDMILTLRRVQGRSAQAIYGGPKWPNIRDAALALMGKGGGHLHSV